ncbi:hypothetical protein C8R46DRAFT_1348469 [Mycena filopes]|nr:hypothetical protein C8R46DRAFT_1348469 [Mycena filopes]
MSGNSFAVGPLSNRPPSYQNQYNLVNEGGILRLAAVSRRILALPPEILAEIFVHCLPQWPTYDALEAPHLLCRVCRQFRAVALSTPRLWSWMCIDLGDEDEEGAYIDFCRTWLSRTGSLPISLDLADDMEAAPDPDHPLLPVIVEWAERLRALEIGGRFWGNILNGGKGSISGRVPLLEELIISRSGELGPVILPDAPKLRVVALDEWTPIQLPWHQLTRISIGYINVPSFFTILQNSTSLLQASFVFFEDPSLDQSFSPAGDNSHAYLQCLHLGVSHRIVRQVPLSLLHHLKTPALEGLSIMFLCENVPLDISPLLSFLSQPSLRLRRLALDFINTPMAELIKCLKLASSLTHLRLTLDPTADSDVLIVQLTGRPEFLPRLEYFALTIFSYPQSHSPTTSWTDAITEMLRWRFDAVGSTQLQSFRYHDQGRSDSPVIDVRPQGSAVAARADYAFWDF